MTDDRHAGTDQFTAMMRRMLRAYPRRVREQLADLNSLEQLVEVQRELDEQLAETVAALRSAEGGAYSWAQIGGALGITRAAAHKRFGSREDAARRAGGQPANMR